MGGRTRANGEGSIYPFRNGFAAYAWVDKPDGTRGRKYVYGKTRDEVHGKWIQLQNRASAGPVATRTPTIASYTRYWLREIVKPNLSPGTYVTYEVACRLYIVPGLGARKLGVTVSEAQSWINKVATACQCCVQGRDARRAPGKRSCCAVGNCCHSVLAPGTVAHIRRTLRSMLGQAMVEELVSRNVASLLKLKPVRTRRRKAWGSDEARRFLESARADRDPLYAAYVLILVMGLRKGEALGLVVDFIDWAGWDQPCAKHRECFCLQCVADYDILLQFDKQLQRIGTELLHRDTKTPGSDSGLPVPPVCAVALRSRLLAMDQDEKVAGPLWNGLPLLFTTRYGTPIEPRNFNRYWDRRCAAAGVPRITVRDARRTCGSLLADLNVHPRVAMQILRHAKFAITMEIYTVVSSKQTRAALKRLGESLT